MKNVKNKLILVLTSAILAASLTVGASAASFTNGTSCPGSSAYVSVSRNTQACQNSAKQNAANVQAAAAKTNSSCVKAATTKTPVQTAAKTAVKGSAVVVASAPTSGNCNTAGNQTTSGSTLTQQINGLLKNCGIDPSSLNISLPNCGNTTTSTPSSNGTSNTSGNTNTTTPSGSGQSSQTTPPSNQSGSGSSNTQNADNQSFEEQVVALVNQQRAANGLQPLTLSATLSNAARAKSQDMHDQHYFAHESPTYGSPFDMLKSFGISYRSAGENIAMGYATPEAVMNGWMNSSGHRANILNASYTQIGVGYVADGNYWTQEFIG